MRTASFEYSVVKHTIFPRLDGQHTMQAYMYTHKTILRHLVAQENRQIISTRQSIPTYMPYASVLCAHKDALHYSCLRSLE